jgi:hypothetical protein
MHVVDESGGEEVAYDGGAAADLRRPVGGPGWNGHRCRTQVNLENTPLDASSGDQIRHRLSRAGNRRLNHVLHIAAIVQIRHNTEGRAYYRRKLAEAKTPMEALRCLKRRLSDMVYRQLVADADAQRTTADEDRAGPGGHSGATPQSSAADLSTPVIGSSDKPQPGPAEPTLPAQRPRSNPTRHRQPAHRVDAPEPSRCSAPPDERP